MAEPRFNKITGDGNKPQKKKTMYLRLGYTQKPRKPDGKTKTSRRGKKPKTEKEIPDQECPGKEQHCRDCKGTNIISPKTLVKEQLGAEAIAPLFEGAIPERHCCSNGGEDCCGEE